MKFYKSEVFKILGIAVLSAVLFNSFSSASVEYIYTPSQDDGKHNVSLEEAKKLYESKEAIFLDARPVPVYHRGHIPGAISVPYNSKEMEKLIADISKDQHIVVYCYSSRCNQARILDKKVRELGYENVSIFEGGIKEWTKVQYPMEMTKIEKPKKPEAEKSKE